MNRALLLAAACLAACAPRSGDDDDSAADAPTEAWADDSEIDAAITHRPGDPCPHPLGVLTLRNPTDADLDFSVAQGGNVNGLSVLTYSDEPFDGADGEPLWLGTLPAGTDFALHAAFNCSDLVTTTAAITGSIDLVGYQVDLQITVE